MDAKISVVVDNNVPEPLRREHGLSLAVEYRGKKILFDTGAGEALLPNLASVGFSPDDFSGIVLSHGHYDHTGGLKNLSPGTLYHAPGVHKTRFSFHSDGSVHNISMPEESVRVFEKCNRREITLFGKIEDGIYLTGPIPRCSGEDCGGKFFHDKDGVVVDTIEDEQAMLLECGILVQGCCHAGIINTLEYCRECCPEVKIHTVIGGLHLLHATRERLMQTSRALSRFGIRKLVPLHCSGTLPPSLFCFSA